MPTAPTQDTSTEATAKARSKLAAAGSAAALPHVKSAPRSFDILPERPHKRRWFRRRSR